MGDTVGMRRIALTFALGFGLLLGACATEKDVVCDVIWTQDGAEVGTATLVYDSLDDVDAGLEMCEVDQGTDDRRPAEANGYTCNCRT